MEITNLLLKRHHFFLLNIQGVAQLVARLLWEIKRFVNPRSKLIHTFSHCKQDHRHTGEYFEHRSFLQALVATSVEADLVLTADCFLSPAFLNPR